MIGPADISARLIVLNIQGIKLETAIYSQSGTASLLFMFQFSTNLNSFKIYKLDSLDNEYKRKSNLLRTFDLPKTEYWDTLRKNKLIELSQEYELTRIAFLSLTNPRILNQFKHNDYCIDKHSKSLIAGGDSLLNDLYSLILNNARRNGNPSSAQERYESILYSGDKYFNARLYVTSYGWWNCAIKYINRSDDIHSSAKEFVKLFLETKEIDCDEP